MLHNKKKKEKSEAQMHHLKVIIVKHPVIDKLSDSIGDF